ncbi:hypothetical protein GOODEAATRI_033727 [Goodea atripinnis]|uniref:Uncharacterized protein n=1 Tax=Goodea atripinnis TaxID=208336 RepID=A0ABV0PJF5_9TELE
MVKKKKKTYETYHSCVVHKLHNDVFFLNYRKASSPSSRSHSTSLNPLNSSSLASILNNSANSRGKMKFSISSSYSSLSKCLVYPFKDLMKSCDKHPSGCREAVLSIHSSHRRRKAALKLGFTEMSRGSSTSSF